MTSSDSSTSVRVVSPLGSGETSRCDPEVDSSGASSGPLSPVDVRVLRDLEVMMSDHDLDTTVTEGSLAMIRERYSIPAEYGLHVPQPGQRPYSLDVPGMCISSLRPGPPSTAREVGASPPREAPRASSKRPAVSPPEQAEEATGRVKKVKVLTRKHKSRPGEGESRCRSKGKEPATQSEEPEVPVGSEEGGASPAHERPRSMKDLFKMKVIGATRSTTRC
ncbi:hypothetical protein BHM03_00047333 [Ensete ventricosum]|nr:hypothetical protein BHM03_00047333 [Ensete ventricosum]